MLKCDFTQEGSIRENVFQASSNLTGYGFLNTPNQSKVSIDMGEKETEKTIINQSKVHSSSSRTININETPEIMMQRIKSSMTLNNYFAYHFGDYEKFTDNVRNGRENICLMNSEQGFSVGPRKSRSKFFTQTVSNNTPIPNSTNQVVNFENSSNLLIPGLMSFLSSTRTINSEIYLDINNKNNYINYTPKNTSKSYLKTLNSPSTYYTSNKYQNLPQMKSPETKEIELLKFINPSPFENPNLICNNEDKINEDTQKDWNYCFVNENQQQNDSMNMGGWIYPEYNSNNNIYYNQPRINDYQNSNTICGWNNKPLNSSNCINQNSGLNSKPPRAIMSFKNNGHFNSRLVPVFSKDGRKICADKGFSNKFDIN